MKEGDVIKPGNFKVTNKITNLNEFWNVINTSKVVYARHRVYPSAFFFSWNIKLISIWLNKSWFYEVERINK